LRSTEWTGTLCSSPPEYSDTRKHRATFQAQIVTARSSGRSWAFVDGHKPLIYNLSLANPSLADIPARAERCAVEINDLITPDRVIVGFKASSNEARGLRPPLEPAQIFRDSGLRQSNCRRLRYRLAMENHDLLLAGDNDRGANG